jgi:FAD synthetase
MTHDFRSSSQQDVAPSIGAAKTGSDDTPRTPRSLPEICYTLRRKVMAFLDEQPEDEVLRNVQSQARLSMGVIDEALGRYGWVPT